MTEFSPNHTEITLPNDEAIAKVVTQMVNEKGQANWPGCVVDIETAVKNELRLSELPYALRKKIRQELDIIASQIPLSPEIHAQAQVIANEIVTEFRNGNSSRDEKYLAMRHFTMQLYDRLALLLTPEQLSTISSAQLEMVLAQTFFPNEVAELH